MGVIYKNGHSYGAGICDSDRIVVSLTAPSAVDTSTKLASYPSGYTMSDSYIEVAYVVLNGARITLDGNNATVWLMSDGIYGVVTSTSYLSGTFSAILRKIPS